MPVDRSSPASAIALLVKTFEEIKCGARTLDPATEIDLVLTEHGLTIRPSSAGNEELIGELTRWVEKYAEKVCPPGCLPLPAQEREINLFARIAIALRHDAQGSLQPAEAQKIAADAIRTFCKSLGAAAVQNSHGVERIYYAGISLNALACAVALAMTSTEAVRVASCDHELVLDGAPICNGRLARTRCTKCTGLFWTPVAPSPQESGQ